MFDRTRCLIEAFFVIERDLRQMRPQPLIIGIRQEREQPVRSSIAIEHGQFFPGLMAASDANGCKPVSGPGRLSRLPSCYVLIFLGAGPGGVFLGKLEKAAAQVQICAIAGETGGNARPVREGGDCAIGLTRNAAGVPPLGALGRRRLRIVAGNL